ncbi:hypothetical protein PBI_SPORTO_77 [Arthrobacter phage Sporto]|nr:hypothetical protein PBI_SPORTO_77 [Arthrobacter phage Sporto]
MLVLFFLVYTAFVMTFTLAVFNGLSFWFPVIFIIAFFIVGGNYKSEEKQSSDK